MLTGSTLPASLTVANIPASEVQALSATVGSSVTGQGADAAIGTIYYGVTDGGTDPGNWESSIELGVQFGVARTRLTGLTERTQYFYRAFATNAGGGGWASETATLTTARLTAPSLINRSAESLTGNSAVLWGEVTDTGNDPPEVTVYYGTVDGGTDPEAWASSAELGTDRGDFSVFVGGLDPETAYHYRSFASNAGGTAWAPATESFSTTDAILPAVVVN
ncbi:MAG: hypothetical protein GWO24_14610, partial [Akkermansiaceae bacterium]|nr:hypothetical protein [Akkermansiaceae bacterium]